MFSLIKLGKTAVKTHLHDVRMERCTFFAGLDHINAIFLVLARPCPGPCHWRAFLKNWHMSIIVTHLLFVFHSFSKELSVVCISLPSLFQQSWVINYAKGHSDRPQNTNKQTNKTRTTKLHARVVVFKHTNNILAFWCEAQWKKCGILSIFGEIICIKVCEFILIFLLPWENLNYISTSSFVNII